MKHELPADKQNHIQMPLIGLIDKQSANILVNGEIHTVHPDSM